jgi:hypothetical protein
VPLPPAPPLLIIIIVISRGVVVGVGAKHLFSGADAKECAAAAALI